MKKLLLLLVVFTTGCATAHNNSAELDWREGEVTGLAMGMAYVFEGDEITFNLYDDTSGYMTGTHKLHIEDDEIEYKLKYVF